MIFRSLMLVSVGSGVPLNGGGAGLKPGTPHGRDTPLLSKATEGTLRAHSGLR